MNFGVNENESNEKKNDSILSKIIPIAIIVVVALVVFILVFAITNTILNSKKTKPTTPTNTTEKLDIKSKDIDILYKYVTTGTNGIRTDKFVKTKKVDKSSFSDEEILYFALQYAEVDDFESIVDSSDSTTLKTDKYQYVLSLSKLKKYITRFFGPGVSMSEYVSIKYPFSFKINGKNVGELKYDEDYEGYLAAFEEYKDLDEKEENLVDEYYTKLVEAYKKSDGTYYLKEKVIYTELEKANDKYTLTIYKDFDKNEEIESKKVSEDSLKNNPIKIEDYIDNASTITYVFKPNTLSQNALYFDSSSIEIK